MADKKYDGLKRGELAEILVGKAFTYEDKDLFDEAVRLVGRKEATLIKMRLFIPLDEADYKYLINVLDRKPYRLLSTRTSQGNQ